MKNETTVMVTCQGNIRALCMMLFSVLNSRYVPHRIKVRLEGDLPGFDDFYLAQVAEFARLAGVRFDISVFVSEGIRAARDWMLDECQTDYLWMLDDDVLVSPTCLVELCRAKFPDDGVALQGGKPDLNNRRGYKDFFKGVHPRSILRDGASPNHRYDQLPEGLPANVATQSYRIHTIDTGNVFLRMSHIREKNLRFSLWPDSVNSGGEDTLFAMSIYRAGLAVYFCPYAVANHLEKPDIRFKEDAARCEMVSRAADLMEVPPEIKERMRHELMSWCWTKDRQGHIVNYNTPTNNTPKT